MRPYTLPLNDIADATEYVAGHMATSAACPGKSLVDGADAVGPTDFPEP